jgi:hypothetical protein
MPIQFAFCNNVAPKGYEQLAKANLLGAYDRRNHQIWAPMAIAGKELLLPSQDELLCVEH